jgi:ribosome-binding factor A
MSGRTIRIGELIQRELSQILRTRYQAEATCITITEVDTAPNLRIATVHFSVIGDMNARKAALVFLRKKKSELRKLVFSAITIKFTPDFEFVYDDSIERGTRIVGMIDEFDLPEDPMPEKERK